MGCPRSISLMSLSAQLYPLCPHSRMHCPSFFSCLLAVTNCQPFWLPREELTAICSVHHHPECVWFRSVSAFRCRVSFHLCANLPSYPGYPWPFDEWPISSRQNYIVWILVGAPLSFITGTVLTLHHLLLSPCLILLLTSLRAAPVILIGRLSSMTSK